MDRLSAMNVFVRVVDESSFTAAARSLGMPRSSVSRQLAALEEHLGARLLNRSTRTMALTEVGRAYYDRCVRILADIDEAETAVASLQTSPRGTLRITAPLSFGQSFLGGTVARFLTEYPDVDVEMSLNDRVVDLVDEGFDLAIRIGRLPDSSLIARKIGTADSVLCASEAYLQRAGQPTDFASLKEHECLRYAFQTMGWRTRGGELLHVKGRMLANNGELLLQAALEGHGVLLSPLFIVGQALQRGELTRLLPETEFEQAGVYAVYPHSRHLSAKVRHFVDFVLREFKGGAPWDLSPPPVSDAPSAPA
ncbi:MAG: LysR family transcriptional regulator [Deltaproteobacteria bacterium]|nr:LysR family transcriptional regulator [Deltaproteobacteria bacterium]